MKAPSPKHWTAREFPEVSILKVRVERTPGRVKRTSNDYVDVSLIDYSCFELGEGFVHM